MPSLLPPQSLQLAPLSLAEPLMNGAQGEAAGAQDVQGRQALLGVRSLRRAPAGGGQVHQERQAAGTSVVRVHGRSSQAALEFSSSLCLGLTGSRRKPLQQHIGIKT